MLKKQLDKCIFTSVTVFIALFLLLFSAAAIFAFPKNTADKSAEFDAAIRKTEQTISASANWLKSAKESKAKINGVSSDSQLTDVTLRSFEDFTLEVKMLVAADLKRNIEDSSTSLEADIAELQTMRDENCNEASPAFDATACQTANSKLKPQITRLKDQKITLETAKTDLVKALTNKYQNISDFSAKLNKELSILTELNNAGFTALDSAKQSEKLMSVLPVELPKLANVIILTKRLSGDWDELKSPLFALTEIAADDVQKNLDQTNGNIGNLKTNLVNWYNTLSTETRQQTVKGNNILTKLFNDAAANGFEASNESKSDEVFSLTQSQIVDQGNDLKGLLKEPTFDTAVENLKDANFSLITLAVRLKDGGIGGDYSHFEGDYVPLYYFTDVPNLMRILNPEMQELRDRDGLREIAQHKRDELNESDLILSNAQVEVNDFQVRVRQLREQLDNAKRAAGSSLGLLGKSQKRLAGISPDDTVKHQLAQQEVDNRSKENDTNQEQLKTLQDEQNGLPRQISDAEARLLVAQKDVRAKRTAMLLLSQTESEAFAKARDAEAVYYAPIDPFSSDPLKRVSIYSFGNRKVIYLRGTRENLEEAKKVIALLDRPAPQARMTLWTLELNGEATVKGSGKFNESLSEVERELSNTRLRIAASISFFRDAVNMEVNRVAELSLATYSDKNQNANPKKLDRNDIQDLRWARLHFYQKEVLLRFGVNLSKFDERANQLYLSRISLPDPAGTSTLGEALIVLTLANPDSRQRILTNFQNNVKNYLDRKMGICSSCQIIKAKCPNQPENSPEIWFPAIYRAMGGDLSAPDSSLTAQQKEIVEALLSATYPRILLRIKSRLNLYVDYIIGKDKVLRNREEIKRIKTLKLSSEDENKLIIKLQSELKEANTKTVKLNAEQVPDDIKLLKFLLHWLWNETDLSNNAGIDSELDAIYKKMDDLAKNNSSSNSSSLSSSDILGTTFAVKDRIQFLEARLGREKSLNTANARVARVDLMLKQMIDAVDEDVDRHFVQPMLICLRTNLIKKGGISVGIIDRTSILSTNRLQARVDARSSAQLAVGDEQDILQGVQQLANIYLATKTGGIFGTFNGLNALPQKDPSEIYGLTSGNVFKVTPIFDPTGQTLRFKFDYVLANQVQEPNGSINPQLPRIERHTVNTEVELNNLELREISRFNTNAKIGIATKKTGGIPLIKDIPQMDRVPLLGWFTRRAGKAAVIQESLIFGQTTMYPTIGDLYELLHGSDYEELEIQGLQTNSMQDH